MTAAHPKPRCLHPELDADRFRLRSALMVGAETEDGVLKFNDRALLSTTAALMAELKLPLSQELDSCRLNAHFSQPEAVKVMNILPQYGGEDFLKSRTKTDILMLCNIPREMPEALHPRNSIEALRAMLKKSFAASIYHEDTEMWRRRISDSGAKAVAVYGADSFDLAELNDGSFVPCHLSGHKGLLLRRDYLEDAEAHLIVSRSPLEPAIYNPGQAFKLWQRPDGLSCWPV